jgi:hypothetical protein
MARLMLDGVAMRRTWVATVLLLGCAPSRSALFDPVDRDVQRRLGVGVAWSEDGATTAAIDALLAKPIDLDAALRIALARNRHLQAQFDELGIAASQVAEATVLPPIAVDADYKRDGSDRAARSSSRRCRTCSICCRSASGAGSRTQRCVVRGHAPSPRRCSSRRRSRWRSTMSSPRPGERARPDRVRYAAISADLVERQHAAGNTNDLALAREQEQRERVRIEVGRADQVVAPSVAPGSPRCSASGESMRGGRPPDACQSHPPAPPKLDDLEQAAIAASLDLTALRADADAAAARHRYAMVRSLVPELGIGVAAARRDGGATGRPALRSGSAFRCSTSNRGRGRARAPRSIARTTSSPRRARIFAPARRPRERAYPRHSRRCVSSSTPSCRFATPKPTVGAAGRRTLTPVIVPRCRRRANLATRSPPGSTSRPGATTASPRAR